MIKTNSNFDKLESQYLFSRIESLADSIPKDERINLGIGDIVRPLRGVIAEAICSATEEMTLSPHGYGPCTGFDFLKRAICQNGYEIFDEDEIFISDGISSDIAALHEIFDVKRVLITNPSYPLYRDASIMAGHEILEVPCKEENGFVPLPPSEGVDLIYLCSPQNPLGITLNLEQMALWVEYAKSCGAVLLFDSAYKCFSPYSIYDVPGANEVAIELCSFSKSAGFTGLRCGFTVVPKSLGKANALWRTRQETKTNGVSYPIQRGAEAALSPQGLIETGSDVAHYQRQASRLHEGLTAKGYTCFGGKNSPYLWWKIPGGMQGWEFCEHLLKTAKVIAVPGIGFGSMGEGYMRLSAFAKEETITKALDVL